MDINSNRMNDLLRGIEEVKRRKIVDTINRDYKFIDPNKYLDDLSVPNNNVVSGRRGCGKTSLLLTCANMIKNTVVVKVDCQNQRTYDEDDIIINILQKIISILLPAMSVFQLDERKKTSILKRINNDKLKSIKKCRIFLNNIYKTISDMEDIPDELEYTTSYNSEKVSERVSKHNFNAGISSTNSISIKYKELNSVNEILAGYKYMYENSKRYSEGKQLNITGKKTIKRSVLIDRISESAIELINAYKQCTDRNIMLILDDFYQIDVEKQVRIIHYFHNIYKNCINSSFCFNLSTLPNRLKINRDNENILSLKDDFSLMELDRDLSEMENLKMYLLLILCNVNEKLSISPIEVERLFTPRTLYYLIIASGGIPRDFLIMFSAVVKDARINGTKNIQKQSIYAVVNDMIEDKANSIEYDADITLEMMEKAKEDINRKIVKEKNTNVFLVSHDTDEKNSRVLRNLVNSRYLHIIKESIASENRKREMFTAYLVDMSFYINSKTMKPGFKARPFWKRDGKSRLKQIESAPIYEFEETAKLA